MIEIKFTKCTGLVCLSFIALAIAGCQEAGQEPKAELPQEFLQPQWEPQEVPVAHIIRRDYRLREGDQLEIIYHVKHQETEDYRMKIQDIVELRFPFNTSLNQTEQVQSDGRLYLDLIGPTEVFDKTTDEVHELLVEKYSEFLANPELTLSFKQSNVKIAELKEAITTSPRGQSRLVPITPDGTVSLPFIGAVRAAGRTISEFHESVNQAYVDINLPELEVTVNVQSVTPMRVYVLGEVRIPGALLNKTGAISSPAEITLLGAIAQAGSYLPGRAELSKVMLVRRRHLPQPEIAIVNVFQLLENRKKNGDGVVVGNSINHRYDIWLEDGDIVYVPTSAIARRADYIDYVWTRGIRAVGGFTSSATYNANDAWDLLQPN